MAKSDVAKFFAAAYDDRKIAGALYYSLANTVPEAIVEVAKGLGYKFSVDDVKNLLGGSSGGKLSDEELAQAAGGSGAFQFARLGQRALSSNIWTRIKSGMDEPAFGLTIPGPSWVQAMCAEERDESEADGPAKPARSAADLYESLSE